MSRSTKKKQRQKSSPIGSMGTGGWGSSFPVDIWRKTGAPQPIDLIRENLGTAFACATLNADGVASTPLRMYVKTGRGEAKSRLSTKWNATQPIGRKTYDWLRSSPNLCQKMANVSDVEEVTSHPLLTLLNRPNGTDENAVGMSSYTFIKVIQMYQEIVGRSYVYMERGGLKGTPSQLWVLPAHLVQEYVDPSTDKLIDKYIYTGSREKQEYDPKEIAPFRMEDLTTAGYLGGMSPLRACFETVYLRRKFNAQTGARLENNARPDAIVSPKKSEDGFGMDDKQAARLQAMINQRFRMGGSGGVLVSDGAIDIAPLQWPVRDIMEPSFYQMTKDEVANAFRVPTTKLSRNDANRASAETGDYAHAKDALLPRCRANEAAFNTFIIPIYDQTDRLFLAFDNPVPENEDRRLERYKVTVPAGAFLRNEMREEADYEKVPWGDQPLVQNTLIAADKTTGLPITPIKPVADSPKPDLQEKSLSILVESMAKMVDALTAKPAEDLLRLRRQLRRARKELKRSKQDGINVTPASTEEPPAVDIAPALTESEVCGDVAGLSGVRSGEVQPAAASGCDIEQPIQDAVRHRSIGRIAEDGLAGPLPQGEELAVAIRHFYAERVRPVAMSKIKDGESIDFVTKDDDRNDSGEVPKPPPTTPIEWFGIDALSPELAKIAAPFLLAEARKAARELSHRLGESIAFDVVDRNLPHAVDGLALKFSTETLQTTSQQLDDAVSDLRTELQEGIEQGDTRTMLRDRVQKVFDDLSDSRAETIAQTETSRAIHEAEQMTAKQSGVVKTKAWLLSADACPECQALAIKGHIPLDEPFATTSYGPVNGPPLHPRCQCSEVLGLKDLSDVEVNEPGNEQ